MQKDSKGQIFIAFLKRLIAILLLFGCAYFMYLQQDSLTSSDKVTLPVVKSSEAASFSGHELSILGDTEIVQQFEAGGENLGLVSLYFHKEGGANSTGTVRFYLQDSSRNTVAETKMDAKFIKNQRPMELVFGGDSEAQNANRIISTMQKSNTSKTTKLQKGKTYYIVMKSEDVATDGIFSVRTRTPKAGTEAAAGQSFVTKDGKAVDGQYLKATLKYKYYDMSLILRFAVILLMALFLILLPLRKMSNLLNRVTGLAARKERRAEAGKRFSFTFDLDRFCIRVMFFLTPLVVFLIIGRISNKDIIDCVQMLPGVRGLLNMMIIGMVWWIVYTICNRCKITIIITTLLGFGFGMINYALLLFRDSPLIATDIAQIGTALDVTKSYELTFNRASLWAVLITVVWIALALVLRDHKGFSLKWRILPLVICIAWCGCFYHTIFRTSVIKDNRIIVSGFKPYGTYRTNGYALAFVVTAKNSIVEKPEGYSPEKVQELTRDYHSDRAIEKEAATPKSPNVIVVMNESFSDLSILGDFETNEDYIPFTHKLKKNTVKGWMHSSVFGGTTADTEFEFLTGYTMKFLPFHSVPYRSIIKHPIPSLTTALKSQDYGGNVAFHPGMADSYNRNIAYPNLGFNRHMSLEDLEDPEKIRDYVSDDYDYRIIEEEYEKYHNAGNRNPFYFFNVTIQNHAAYTLAGGEVKAGITIETDACQTEQAQQFLNLMKKSDDALKGLIRYFKKVKEPTVIVLFGDHQPRLEDSFYEGIGSTNQNMEEVEKRYRVPFLIWANYDIEEEQGVELSANYLSAYTKKVIGADMTGYDKYLIDLHEKLPVITAIGYADPSGKVYNPEKPSEYDDLLLEYQMIQYNGLIDSKHRVKGFFDMD